jgi:glycosyltransferase involved in cell wall biosynthesis
MRIAYVVSQYPALSETFIAREIEQLCAFGHDVRIARLRWQGSGYGQGLGRRVPEATVLSRPWTPGALASGLAWAVRRRRPALRRIGRDLGRGSASPSARARLAAVAGAALAHARQISEAGGVDHVRANFFDTEALAAAWIGRLTGIPYSITASTPTLRFPEPLIRTAVRQAAFCAATTRESYDLSARYRNGDDRVVMVRRGVRVPEADPVVDRPEWHGGDELRVLGVGRLVEKKGFGVLVDACAHLVERGVDVRCEIVGDGPLGGALKRRAQRRGLSDRVVLRGALPFEEVQRRYAASDVVAVPSRLGTDHSGRDGLPNVVIEALAAGVPVVGSDYAGIPDLIDDGRTGRLVPAGDAEALAGALREVRDRPARAAGWARRGRDAVRERYSLKREVQRLVACIKRTSPEARPAGPNPFAQQERAGRAEGGA